VSPVLNQTRAFARFYLGVVQNSTRRAGRRHTKFIQSHRRILLRSNSCSQETEQNYDCALFGQKEQEEKEKESQQQQQQQQQQAANAFRNESKLVMYGRKKASFPSSKLSSSLMEKAPSTF